MTQYSHHPGVKSSPDNLPQHVAIIMDGNGRWALARKLSRTIGHRRGVEVVREIIGYCVNKKIPVLTLFAFGRENWKRPSKEVRNLFRIFFLVLRKEVNKLHQDNIKLRIIGERTGFNEILLNAITTAENLTANNTGLILNVAVNYSGRWDLLNAIANLGPEVSEESLSQRLSLGGLPEPDLFIRTGGVLRLSNFILWDLAYTELYFTDTLWPDFRVQDFETALSDFASRERRFGKTSEQLSE